MRLILCGYQFENRRKLNIRYKPHALVRMKERRIEHRHVEYVLASPAETVDVRFSRQASFGNIYGRRLLVIYQVSASMIEVVTAFWINEEGLRKYGFTRI
jgi:hypothetical protein